MQDELGFDQPGRPDGLSAWRAQRAEALREFSRANGLPLGHPCRVELGGGTVLEGRLILAEEILFLSVGGQRQLDLRLQIGRRVFTPREVVSVVRLD